MIVEVVQRWREGRATYRPAREVVSTSSLDVDEIADDNPAKVFVIAHHYERSYPAARFRFGLYERGELVGVVVFSQPVNDLTLACLPGTKEERVELGRLVLLDRVGANAETWLIARCFDSLRREGIAGVVSFSDPMRREALDGRVITPGHVGTIYQASNAVFLGRTRKERRLILDDGTIVHNRALAKIRKRERGWRPNVDRLVRHGAEPLRDDEDSSAWLRRELPLITRSVPHPGNLKYAWTLNRRDRKHLPKSKPYPKLGRECLSG